MDEVPDRPTIRLASVHSGKCLNIPQGSTANSVGVIQYNCSSGAASPNERFYLPPTASPNPVARPFTSKQAIAVRQGATPAGGGLRTPANGALGIFAVVGGALWYAPETVNDTQPAYGAWRSLGGTGLTGTPVVQRTATDTQVFVLNTSGQLLTATLVDRTLSDWTNLGGSGLNGTPAVVVYAGYLYGAAARSADGTIVDKIQQQNGTWPADWTPLAGQQAAGSPSITYSPSGRFKIAARGTDNLIYYTSETAIGAHQFGDWVQVSDPTNYPESVAAGDPTLFTYDVPSGASFGIAFRAPRTWTARSWRRSRRTRRPARARPRGPQPSNGPPCESSRPRPRPPA